MLRKWQGLSQHLFWSSAFPCSPQTVFIKTSHGEEAETTKSKVLLTSLHHLADRMAFSTPLMKHLPVWHLCKDPASMCFCLPAHRNELIPQFHTKTWCSTPLGCASIWFQGGVVGPLLRWVRHHLKSEAVWVRWPTRSSRHSVSLQTWNIKPPLDCVGGTKLPQVKGKSCYPLKPVTWVGSGAHKTICVEQHLSVVISVSDSLTDTEVTGTE